jgi:hypothetical protein
VFEVWWTITEEMISINFLSSFMNFLKQKKFSVFLTILLTLFVVYFLFFPTRYFFDCVGETTTSKFTLPSKDLISKNTYKDDHYLSVQKYIFGLFYTLDQKPFLNCKNNWFDPSITCEMRREDDGYIWYVSFDKFKSDLLIVTRIFSDKKTIEDNAVSDLKCSELSNVLK